MVLSNEYDLIQKARLGNLEAYNQIVLAYQTLVYNHALWMMRDPQAAEDLTQETFIKAYLSLNQYKGGSFRAWLLRIVSNDCIDEWRRIKRCKTCSTTCLNSYGEEIEDMDWLQDPGLSVEEKAAQRDLQIDLERCLCALPEEYRRTVVLVDVFDMDYAEAASTMKVPIGTIKSRLARARSFLRKSLESHARESHTPQFQPA
jgi:RNA polymerase sigma-70 factor (ECF subfamily)